MIPTAIAVFTGLLGLTNAASSAFASETPTASIEAQMTSATFSIAKMTCATCPISVKKAMKRVDGVKTVDIDFETKVATVTFDPSITNPETIAAASSNVGYPATPVTG